MIGNINKNGSNLIISAIKHLQENNVIVGKTLLQKTIFLLSLVNESNVPFEFVLYKHGPYSFELDNAISSMRNNLEVDVTPEEFGYRLSIVPNNSLSSDAVLGANVERQIGLVAKTIAGKDVKQLEAMATAAWVIKRETNDDVVKRVKELKSHLDESKIQEGHEQVSTLLADLSL